jgi:hypothetical protein
MEGMVEKAIKYKTKKEEQKWRTTKQIVWKFKEIKVKKLSKPARESNEIK